MKSKTQKKKRSTEKELESVLSDLNERGLTSIASHLEQILRESDEIIKNHPNSVIPNICFRPSPVHDW